MRRSTIKSGRLATVALLARFAARRLCSFIAACSSMITLLHRGSFSCASCAHRLRMRSSSLRCGTGEDDIALPIANLQLKKLGANLPGNRKRSTPDSARRLSFEPRRHGRAYQCRRMSGKQQSGNTGNSLGDEHKIYGFSCST